MFVSFPSKVPFDCVTSQYKLLSTIFYYLPLEARKSAISDTPVPLKASFSMCKVPHLGRDGPNRHNGSRIPHRHGGPTALPVSPPTPPQPPSPDAQENPSCGGAPPGSAAVTQPIWVRQPPVRRTVIPLSREVSSARRGHPKACRSIVINQDLPILGLPLYPARTAPAPWRRFSH